jgi:polar amino acid transport system substrate-binding protein
MWGIRVLATALSERASLLFLIGVFVLSGLGPFSAGRAAHADVIELRAGTWCPYVCRSDTSHPGLLIELTREALAPFGHEIRYETLSWSRSLTLVHTGAVNGLLGPEMYKISGLIFTRPITHHQDALAFRRDEARPVQGLRGLQGLQLGAVQDYRYSNRLAQYIAENRSRPSRVQLINGQDTIARNLKKLLNHRVDLVLEAQAVLIHRARQLGLSDLIDIQPYSAPRAIRLGFSPALPSSARYVQQFNAGLAQLQHSGRYHEILVRYAQAGSFQ